MCSIVFQGLADHGLFAAPHPTVASSAKEISYMVLSRYQTASCDNSGVIHNIAKTRQALHGGIRLICSENHRSGEEDEK